MSWLKQIIGTEKAIIAMCHLQPLPGDPYYNPEKGMEYALAQARNDLHALQEGGVDAVMFSNEFSLPYLTKVEPVTLSAMAYIIGRLHAEIRIPFGVNALWDAGGSLDLAAATGALFVREIFTGVYASDFGLWNTNVGKTIRHRKHIDAQHVKLLFNIVPEAAKYMADRDLEGIAKTTIFNNRPDALCVSGITAGAATDTQSLKRVKDAAGDTVVLANTGVRIENVEQQLSIADGAVVGTTFKVNGIFENNVDQERVKRFMDKVKTFRGA
jgi:membrane complex biogenesis BtpA family protein